LIILLIKWITYRIYFKNIMEKIYIKDDFIKLGQALKLSGVAGSGVDAKYLIEDGLVAVNGETELRRGRKLYKGDSFSFEEREFEIDGL